MEEFYVKMTEYDKASKRVKKEYDDQTNKHGRVTNMKRTLLHDIKAFKIYMGWYELKDEIVPFLGERAVSIFSYAISEANDCLICSTFFRKILIDNNEDLENLQLNETEQLLFDLGKQISTKPHDIDEAIYAQLKKKFNTKQIVLIFSFAGIMAATNLFNTITKIPLDEVLYQYKKETK